MRSCSSPPRFCISSIARFDQADTLISDSGLEAEARAALEGQVHDLLIVEPSSGSSAVAMGGGSFVAHGYGGGRAPALAPEHG